MTKRKSAAQWCPYCQRDMRVGGHSVTCKEGKCIECGHPAIPGLQRCAPHHQRAIKDADYERRQAVIRQKLERLDGRGDL
jgi:hypothetical protein